MSRDPTNLFRYSTTMTSLLVLLGLVSVAMAAPTTHSPPFCNHLECPSYTVLKKTQDYELRHYEAVTWIATNASGANVDDERYAMFMRLFHYIDGSNAKNVKIPMTSPVLTTVSHGEGPNCASFFTMHFLLPADQWSAPVQPTDSQVFFATTPAMDVYVRVFGGYARDSDQLQNLLLLSDSLQKENISFEDTYYYTAGYDSPYKFTNRHNEVWLAANNSA